MPFRCPREGLKIKSLKGLIEVPFVMLSKLEGVMTSELSPHSENTWELCNTVKSLNKKLRGMVFRTKQRKNSPMERTLKSTMSVSACSQAGAWSDLGQK